MTDHAESQRPEHWQSSKESARECDALAGDPANPDVVAFAGFEWTQAGKTPEEHFGHRCLVFKDEEDAALPARTIASDDCRATPNATARRISQGRFIDPLHWKR